MFTLSDIKNSACGSRNPQLEGATGKKSKYGNKKVELDGHFFDSKGESRRYVHLRMLQSAGEITGLRVHTKFTLLSCSYEADFDYFTKDGVYIVEDFKGFKTQLYRLKRKMMKNELGIEITEVR